MSRSSLAKKVHLAKKAWKSFTITLQSKFHKLKNSKVIKTTTHRLLAMRSFRSLFPFKKHPLTKSSYRYSQHYYQHHNNQPQKNFSAIHIDQLFDEPVSVHTKNRHAHAHAETSKGKEVLDEKISPTKSNSIYSVEDAWKVVVASSPHLQVDERAEEFISKFREEIKLQKERSILEFQEMLDRSA
ncbi:Cotton fiber protein [Fagus crenata]